MKCETKIEKLENESRHFVLKSINSINVQDVPSSLLVQFQKNVVIRMVEQNRAVVIKMYIRMRVIIVD